MHLYWLRKDLRVQDNTALHAACKGNVPVLAVYLYCESAWKRHHLSRAQVQFMWLHLQAMQSELNGLGIPLKIIRVARWDGCSKAIEDVIKQHHAKAVFFNKQYEVDERRRDGRVLACCEKLHVEAHAYDDQTLIAPGEVLTKQDQCYTVFTPFKKSCYQYMAKYGAPPALPKPSKRQRPSIPDSLIPALPKAWTYPVNEALWPVGEQEALSRLRAFCREHVMTYHQSRDIPLLNLTSRLSAYLAIGVLSPRQCLHMLLRSHGGAVSRLGQGARTWLDELWWRDFYKCIMWFHPRVCMHQPYKEATSALKWSNKTVLFEAWKHGQTGFPLIDAAMRQLNQTAWMHNRLRMVTAMFLVKNCDVDWRWGERYFSERLIDLDLSSNNGGWQWSASTGTDAAPYFRVFNPVSQSERFDPDGEFIKLFCPELASLDAKKIHLPGSAAPNGYPSPILDHKSTRQKSIAKFKALKSGG